MAATGRVWKRFNYLTHRWIGIVLGVMVFVWFGSGIVMMYYPYPELTESQVLGSLQAYQPSDQLIGFRAAVRSYSSRSATGRSVAISGGRLALWNGRLVYSLWRADGVRTADAGLVDASTGEVLTPISGATAAQAARAMAGPLAPLRRVELLARSDHYFMGNEHRAAFPVYRVQFGDEAATAVYVSRNSGTIPAVANRVTRLTTWFGTVPHWLYFMALYYDHPGAWEWVNIVLPGIAVVLALTGIILGVYQLFPRRRRGEWRISGYHGMSLWHHVAGVACGVLVLTWALSGLLEMFGVGNEPRPGQVEQARGGAMQWDHIRVTEATALERLRSFASSPVIPKAIDLVQCDGHPGYEVWLEDGRTYWVGAEDGAPRGALPPEAVRTVANRVMGPGARAVTIEHIGTYDTYYYARHGREKRLPAWRVSFDDRNHSVLYLDPVTGQPVGFVDADVRAWRWWRDGLHDFDLPALNNNRPWWDLVVLPFMIGGTLSAITGVWLLLRRVKRLTAT